jgi:hypothetical protein
MLAILLIVLINWKNSLKGEQKEKAQGNAAYNQLHMCVDEWYMSSSRTTIPCCMFLDDK